MSDQPLIVRDDSNLTVLVPESSQALKDAALAEASLVLRVNSAESQAYAVESMRSLSNLLKAVEAARESIKAPVLMYGRKIDDAAKTFVKELVAEKFRVEKLVADFQALEQAKARAAEAQHREELSRIEREREAAKANAKSLEDVERINEEANQKAAFLSPPPAPPKADGLAVKEEWSFEVENLHQLYSFHPSLVELTPKRQPIKDALKAGMKIQGIRAWQETKASVRTNKNALVTP